MTTPIHNNTALSSQNSLHTALETPQTQVSKEVKEQLLSAPFKAKQTSKKKGFFSRAVSVVKSPYTLVKTVAKKITQARGAFFKTKEVHQEKAHKLDAELAQEFLMPLFVAKYAYHNESEFLSLDNYLKANNLSSKHLQNNHFQLTEKRSEILAIKNAMNELGFMNIRLEGEGAIIDKTSGLRFTILEDEAGNVHLGFGGTTAGSSKTGIFKQLVADIDQFTGDIPLAYTQAAVALKLLKDRHPEKNIITSGHSLGGGLAQYAGIMNDTPVYAFNAAALGVEAMQMLAKASKLNENVRELTKQLSIHHDLVSDFPGSRKLEKLLSWFNIGSPANLGERYVVRPKSKRTDPLERHSSLTLIEQNLGVIKKHNKQEAAAAA